MKAFRQLTVSLLGLATLAACGHTNVATAPTSKLTSAHTVMAAGKARKLGYNFTRYQHLQASQAHLQHLVSRAPLKASADNRQFCAPVYDQGQLGSCTAFSMAKGLREYQQRKNGEQQVPLSALAFYYNERALSGNTGDDTGASMSDGMNVLTDSGAAVESLWPYDISKFTQAPSDEANASAAAWKISSKTQVASIDDIKTAVNDGNAVAIGFVVYESFMNITSNGVMPNPKSSEGVLGGHAVLVVGYDDKKQLLTVRNSWSDTWGDKGYFYMPYKFAKDFQNHIIEAWTSAK